MDKCMTDKPNILMIAPLPPPVHGSAMMTKYIKDSAYINARINLDWINLSTSRKIDEIGKKSIKKIFRFIQSYIKTLYKLIFNDYDKCYLAITCHGLGFLKDAPYVLICKLFRRRIIIHQHNKGMSKDFNKPFYRWLFKTVYKNTEVVLLSWRLYPDIESIVNKGQVKICPNGIIEVPRLPKKINSKPRILFLSNLMKSKGVFTILDACKILNDKGIASECRLVGGETKEIDNNVFQQAILERGIKESVKYLGKKYNDEKYYEISQTDIFVFPTADDCFPLVVLEAMQQGIPVISTTEGGIPDIVTNNETGLIINPNAPNELADAIIRLINAPEERQRLGKNGYEKYLKFFTLRKFEENIVKVLES